ncbi:hypothetical protein DEO72_LG7g413 [Vigna unguiculata]|uniref:Uncharacterized protein n=1 Tax=Vigna unguiculata TaxID=3917 RepID=A0A4D6MEC3_VIGUN|nr:hypothetical protein DEO72_LG7g413 [Vigna unguiculata]
MLLRHYLRYSPNNIVPDIGSISDIKVRGATTTTLRGATTAEARGAATAALRGVKARGAVNEEESKRRTEQNGDDALWRKTEKMNSANGCTVPDIGSISDIKVRGATTTTLRGATTAEARGAATAALRGVKVVVSGAKVVVLVWRLVDQNGKGSWCGGV